MSSPRTADHSTPLRPWSRVSSTSQASPDRQKVRAGVPPAVAKPHLASLPIPRPHHRPPSTHPEASRIHRAMASLLQEINNNYMPGVPDPLPTNSPPPHQGIDRRSPPTSR